MIEKENKGILEESVTTSSRYNNSMNMHDYWASKEKKDIFLNSREEDKEKLIQLEAWSYRALELSILERNVKFAPVRGDIWSLDLGVNIGDEMDKTRPCIIVSYDIFNNKSNLCTIIPITHAYCSHRTQFQIDENCLEYSENSITGTAKAEQITTKSKARLGRKIGRLNEKGMQLMNMAILNHLAMDGLIDMAKSISHNEYNDDIMKKLEENNLLFD